MTIKFEDATAYCSQLVSGYSRRKTMYDELEKMFLLTPGDLPDKDGIKDTVSPDARNTLLGAVRLLTATDPRWKIQAETNSDAAQRVSSAMEQMAARVFRANGRIKKKPLHYLAALSALMYDEVAITVTSTENLVAMADANHKARAEEIAKLTPILFEVVSPQVGYPAFSSLGLEAYHSCQKLKARDVIAKWGKRSGLDESDPFKEVEYNEYWDMVDRCVWITGSDKPIILEAHGLPEIPVACGTVEGSSEFFTKADQQSRQPFLYALWKSNLWKRQNLSLTLIYSMMFWFAANTQWVLERQNPTDEIEMDFETPGGVSKLPPGAKLSPLKKEIIDPSFTQMMQMADQKISESTIYRQALGEPLGANAPYSMVALLNQAGRLPLVPYQRMLGWVLGDAMSIGYKILKTQGGTIYKGEDETTSLKATDIPDAFDLQAELDVAMPQDDAQNVRIAKEATEGESPLMAVETAAERYLQIDQYDAERKKIMQERFLMVQMAQAMQAQIQATQTPQATVPAQPMTQPMTPRGQPQGV